MADIPPLDISPIDDKVDRRLQALSKMGCLLAALPGLLLVLAGVIFATNWAIDWAWRESIPLQVTRTLDKQVEAWNRGDLKGFMEGYWESDDLRFYSGNTVTQGWNATLERYRKKYQADGAEMGTLTFTDLDIQPIGKEDAFVRGRWKVVTSKGTFEGLFTLIVKHFSLGGWRIVHDHTSN